MNQLLSAQRPWRSIISLMAVALPLAVMSLKPALAQSSTAELAYIVDTEWLISQLKSQSSGLKIIDVRPADEYATGHIPGAISFPVELSFENTRIVSIRRVGALLGERGISNDDKLVLYDNGQIRDAAHVFWMLETYGHENVMVLDAGLPGWIAAGLALSHEDARHPSTDYVPSIRSSHLTTKLGALLALNNNNVTIIDSREISEFKGEKSRASRYGHIPSALHIDMQSMLENSAGYSRLKSANKLGEIYRDVDKNNEVITYCNRGKDSAMNYLIMRSLGYKASIYDGGWLEWGNDPKLPISNQPLTKQ